MSKRLSRWDLDRQARERSLVQIPPNNELEPSEADWQRVEELHLAEFAKILADHLAPLMGKPVRSEFTWRGR